MRILDNLIRQVNSYSLAGNQTGSGGSQPQASSPAPSSSTVQLSPTAMQLGSQPQYSALQGFDPLYTNNIKLTKDKTIDALLAGGNYWWHLGTAFADGSNPSQDASKNLSFSFMNSAVSPQDAFGFQVLNDDQKDVIRAIFAQIATVVGITFSEDGSGNGTLKIGSNNQQGISGGYAYYPNVPTVGGSFYLANDQANFSNMSTWNPGGYTWTTIIHELGHALGLKHPGNYNAGGDGKTPGPYLGSKDSKTNSIMSYKDDKKFMHVVQSNGGGGLFSYQVNPDSFQNYDIAALQYLYGAPNSAITTFSFNDNMVFSRSIFNNNADSKIDLSAMTQNNIIDLRGGYRSSIGIRDPYEATGMTKEQYKAATSGGVKLSKLLGVPTYSGMNNLGIAKGSQIREVIGGAGSDTIVSGAEIGGEALLKGGAGNDRYFVASGNATIIDTSGDNDTLYVVKKSGTVWTLSEDQTTLTQVNKKTNEVLATINIAGIENIGTWSGKAKLNGSKKMLFSGLQQGSPIQQIKTVEQLDQQKLGVSLDLTA
ncbi:reprolysin-like metallopeptidase [Geminocystis sp. CENA526]|uniref:reprolysin-like metallopeptidase n=1 Tax=Geminocystis sp. CENA526 TaxID=1355871 RepID=UPI003D6DF699